MFPAKGAGGGSEALMKPSREGETNIFWSSLVGQLFGRYLNGCRTRPPSCCPWSRAAPVGQGPHLGGGECGAGAAVCAHRVLFKAVTVLATSRFQS